MSADKSLIILNWARVAQAGSAVLLSLGMGVVTWMYVRSLRQSIEERKEDMERERLFRNNIRTTVVGCPYRVRRNGISECPCPQSETANAETQADEDRCPVTGMSRPTRDVFGTCPETGYVLESTSSTSAQES